MQSGRCVESCWRKPLILLFSTDVCPEYPILN
jgi:hypothetical protein